MTPLSPDENLIIKLALAEEKDLPDLIAYLSTPAIDQAFVKPLSQRTLSIRERVNQDFKNGTWILARYEGRIVGCFAIIYHDFTAELSTFFLSPEMRGHHLGSKILKDAEIILEGLFPEVRMIAIDSWEGNTVLKTLVEHLGYTQINAYEDTAKRPAGTKTIVYGKDIKK